MRGEGRSGCGALLEEKNSGCTREESRVRDLDLGRNGRQCALRGEMPNARGGRGWKGQERRAARPVREIAICGSTCKGRKARVLHGTHCHCLLHCTLGLERAAAPKQGHATNVTPHFLCVCQMHAYRSKHLRTRFSDTCQVGWSSFRTLSTRRNPNWGTFCRIS